MAEPDSFRLRMKHVGKCYSMKEGAVRSCVIEMAAEVFAGNKGWGEGYL